jgi:hypothetical protein
MVMIVKKPAIYFAVAHLRLNCFNVRHSVSPTSATISQTPGALIACARVTSATETRFVRRVSLATILTAAIGTFKRSAGNRLSESFPRSSTGGALNRTFSAPRMPHRHRARSFRSQTPRCKQLILKDENNPRSRLEFR